MGGMTLAELGKRAKVSQATVSRVLANNPIVSRQIRERVLEAAHACGYVPRPPRAPRQSRINACSVEVVLHRHSPVERIALQHGQMIIDPPMRASPDGMLSESNRLSNGFHRHIAEGIMEELGRQSGKAVMRVNEDLLEPAFLHDMERSEARGVILLGEYSPSLGAFVEQCRHPLVLVDLLVDGWPDMVTIDNRRGMEAVVRCLVTLGHRDIGYVGGPINPSFADRRRMFLEQMREAGLTVRPEWCCPIGEPITLTAETVAPLLQSRHRPTVLVCANDCAAFGVMRAAKACGLTIPRDVSVVGFDDTDLAPLVNPSLTTVHVPLAQLGRTAVRLLLTQQEAWPHPSNGGTETRVRPHLVVRQSTAAPGHRRKMSRKRGVLLRCRSMGRMPSW